MEYKVLENTPKYNPEDILKAIKAEGLCVYCYGYKTPTCIWIVTNGMEKDEIWDKFPSPLKGYEQAFWDNNKLMEVTYFLLDRGCE